MKSLARQRDRARSLREKIMELFLITISLTQRNKSIGVGSIHYVTVRERWKCSVWSFLLFWNEGSLMKKYSPQAFESHAKTTRLNFADSPSSIVTRSEIYFPLCLRANGEEETLTGQLSNWSLGKRAPWGNFWWSSKTTTSLDQMLKERERERQRRRWGERGNRDREMACKHSGIMTESESALHGEERMEQLNNRKDWEKDNVSSTEFLLR